MTSMMIQKFVQQALEEDLGRGDLYARIVDPKPAKAAILSKQDGLLAGETYAAHLAEVLDITIRFLKHDGDAIAAGDFLVELEGSDVALLQAERTMLNLLQHASGIATLANRYAAKLADSPVKLLDTRKTRPLLREFEKYAARIGGVVNHRLGLDDCLMLKDTHRAGIDDLDGFIQQARQKIPFTAKIEVECGSVSEAKSAMGAGADIVMCDNMPAEAIREVVMWRNANHPGILLEASGNVTLETVELIAQTGVDAISSGSIIHQAVWLDFSMKMH